MNDIKTKREDVDQAVIDFCMYVIKNPLIYFNESDLHLLLIEKLFDKIPSLQYQECETNIPLGEDLNGKYKTRMLHREYGGGEGTRMDIVIFNEDDIKDIRHPHLTKKDAEDYLEPRFAFELGICTDETEDHITNDINKFKMRCQKGIGYLIHIIRDETVARSDTKERRKKEIKIDEKFKNVIETKSRNIPNNIKLIAIRLNLIRKNEKDWIRVEIFNKNNEENGWEKYHRKDIENGEEIERMLASQLQ